MKKTTVYLILLLACGSLFSQETIGIIKPGERFQNTYEFNLFYMPREKVLAFKNLATRSEFDSLKIVLYQEQLKTYEERIFLADSASNLKKLEADYWHDKLLANDTLLETERKTNVELRADLQRVRQSRVYYFLAGIVATSLAIGALQ